MAPLHCTVPRTFIRLWTFRLRRGVKLTPRRCPITTLIPRRHPITSASCPCSRLALFQHGVPRAVFSLAQLRCNVPHTGRCTCTFRLRRGVQLTHTAITTRRLFSLAPLRCIIPRTLISLWTFRLRRGVKLTPWQCFTTRCRATTSNTTRWRPALVQKPFAFNRALGLFDCAKIARDPAAAALLTTATTTLPLA